MSDTIISVEKLGKKYIIGHQQERHDTLRDLIANRTKSLLNPFNNKKSKIENNKEEFWALNDVSFEIKQGDRVGIVGHNGAGKSTLLKILSRITEPTTGSIKIKGRVASLLEVGTGFHPELTGRENIYLNGAILGMSKTEIKSKFDEIVAFAEVEKFLDTPVKHYSSGMYVRLAFAVAAHLEPEILIIDEVLAVGDAAFQKKCIGKIQDVGSSGKTILFVSHNMVTLSALCSRAIYFNKGNLLEDSSSQEVISRYLSSLQKRAWIPLHEREDRTGDGRLRFTKIWLENALGEPVSKAVLGQTIVFCLACEIMESLENVFVAFDIRDLFDDSLTNCNTEDTASNFAYLEPGKRVFRCQLSHFPIRAGLYSCNIYCSDSQGICDFLCSAYRLEVEDGDFYGTGSLKNTCRVMLHQDWSVSLERLILSVN
ncbi:ABC transporter ATP-binding protein [Calothrix membranacea FACHB-236]|nr:ABC transporter ATP-binding protein [Calothrix membranacea FACHB-236]